jgi:cytochrome c
MGVPRPMDAFEVNKTAGAVLSALLVIFAGRALLDIADKEHKPEKPGWALPITEPTATATAPAAAAFDVAKVIGQLAKANPDDGRDVFKRCLQCHTSEKDGPNRVGPNLWGIVGRARASRPGFPYSDAMKSHPGNWTFEELAKYLHDPRADIPGNKMAFVGIKDNAQLADLLVYLRNLNDSPAPLPQ